MINAPDGSTLAVSSTFGLVTSAGTWSFSATANAFGNLILLNGQSAASGSAVELEVANGGNLYADNSQGQWWLWNGSGWGSTSDPKGSTSPSPDGSTLTPGSGGTLITSTGAWSFGNASNAYGNLILLNGQSAAAGSATQLEVARGGNLFADNSQGQWWEWNGSGWSSTSDPNGSASPSPDGSMLTPGNSGTLITSAGAWSFGNASNAYGNLILLNGQSAAAGSATQLEVARGGNLFADNSQGQWWEWNGSGWSGTSDPNSSGGRILTVGPGQQFSTIADAINASQNGDTIQVQAGTYVNDYATINTNITLQGVGGMVNMVSTELIPNGKAILITRGNDTINNFSFSGAEVNDSNGAGIRYEGGNLILNNDYFHDNQEGLLAASDPAGSITINNSEFAFNGDGSGSTHNLYVNEIGTLTINNSYFHDAVVGHEIKSRADNTIITNSRIQDENGSASYSIDLPNGGRAVIENNIIQQGPNSQNSVIVTAGEEGNVYGNTQLTVDFNTFLNDLTSSSVVAVRNSTNATADISGDQFYGLTPSQVAAGLSSQSGNTFLGSEPALITTHPWLA